MNVRQATACWVISLLAGGSPALAAGGGTILDETCYLRRYYRFATDLVCPAAMKDEGPRVLGKTQYERLGRTARKSLGRQGHDNFAVFRPSPWVLAEARKVGTMAALRAFKGASAAAADWRELVFRRMFFDPYTAPPPPADWAEAAFDDATWVLGRGPFQVDMPDDLPPEATRGNMAKVHVGVLQYIGTGLHAACYRGRFLVDDPARAGALTFTAISHVQRREEKSEGGGRTGAACRNWGSRRSSF